MGTGNQGSRRLPELHGRFRRRTRGYRPDWQELHEKLNASIIGHGPTFCKFTGSRGKYGANDAHPEYIGWLRGVLNRKNIPWQMAELGKVDHAGAAR